MPSVLVLEGFLFEIPESLDDWEDMLEIDCLNSYKRDWDRHWTETRNKLMAESYENN